MPRQSSRVAPSLQRGGACCQLGRQYRGDQRCWYCHFNRKVACSVSGSAESTSCAPVASLGRAKGNPRERNPINLCSDRLWLSVRDFFDLVRQRVVHHPKFIRSSSADPRAVPGGHMRNGWVYVLNRLTSHSAHSQLHPLGQLLVVGRVECIFIISGS